MARQEADLLSIGQHCSHPECRQLDFLPFHCEPCGRVFCLEHRMAAAHNCPKAAEAETHTIVCPICAKAIKLKATEDANAAFDRHSASGCDPSNYARVHQKKRCPVPNCKEKLTTTNTYRCRECKVEVCLKHRLASDHKCQGKKAVQATSFTRLFSRAPENNKSTKQPTSWSTDLSKAATQKKSEGQVKPSTSIVCKA